MARILICLVVVTLLIPGILNLEIVSPQFADLKHIESPYASVPLDGAFKAVTGSLTLNHIAQTSCSLQHNGVNVNNMAHNISFVLWDVHTAMTCGYFSQLAYAAKRANAAALVVGITRNGAPGSKEYDPVFKPGHDYKDLNLPVVMISYPNAFKLLKNIKSSSIRVKITPEKGSWREMYDSSGHTATMIVFSVIYVAFLGYLINKLWNLHASRNPLPMPYHVTWLFTVWAFVRAVEAIFDPKESIQVVPSILRNVCYWVGSFAGYGAYGYVTLYWALLVNPSLHVGAIETLALFQKPYYVTIVLTNVFIIITQWLRVYDDHTRFVAVYTFLIIWAILCFVLSLAIAGYGIQFWQKLKRLRNIESKRRSIQRFTVISSLFWMVVGVGSVLVIIFGPLDIHPDTYIIYFIIVRLFEMLAALLLIKSLRRRPRRDNDNASDATEEPDSGADSDQDVTQQDWDDEERLHRRKDVGKGMGVEEQELDNLRRDMSD